MLTVDANVFVSAATPTEIFHADSDRFLTQAGMAGLELICLRGADAVYIAVAQEFGTTLVTWDAEMLARGLAAVPTLTQTDWLAANPIV